MLSLGRGMHSLLIPGIEQINDHLNIDDILPSISIWDKSSLVMANFIGQDRAQTIGPYPHDQLVVYIEEGDGAELVCGIQVCLLREH
jgi:hypothetical protein